MRHTGYRICMIFLCMFLASYSASAQKMTFSWDKNNNDRSKYWPSFPNLSIEKKNRLGITRYKTEPIFSHALIVDSIVVASIPINVYDNKNKQTKVTDNIWLCLDSNLKIRFLFPKGTRDIVFVQTKDKKNYYEYTDGPTGNGFPWLYCGLIDNDGNIVFEPSWTDIDIISDSLWIATLDEDYADHGIIKRQYYIKRGWEGENTSFCLLYPMSEYLYRTNSDISYKEIKEVYDSAVERIGQFDFNGAVELFHSIIDRKGLREIVEKNISELYSIRDMTTGQNSPLE